MSDLDILKNCPFHGDTDCCCYADAEMDMDEWNHRPAEDALRRRVEELEKGLRLAMDYTDDFRRAGLKASQRGSEVEIELHAIYTALAGKEGA